MKFIEKVCGTLGLIEPGDTKEQEQQSQQPVAEERAPRSARPSAAQNNVVNLPHAAIGSTAAAASKQMKVMVVEPANFDDVQHVADYLKNRKPVVVNFETTDKEVAKRMIDFMSGTTYALGGSIQKVGHHIFLCAPANVDVAYTYDDQDRTVVPWMNN
nr:cell division protein SepF [uncultured Anaeromusa sp.]